MIRPLALLVLLLTLAACGGLDRARSMPQDEIAVMSDEDVCGYLSTFAYKGRLPEAWENEAVRRDLTRCIDDGIKKRAVDTKLDRTKPILCPQGKNTQDSRCW
ncbi:MAG: hypothetical protein P1U88_10925 [Thalassobaculaceae bacterium]|nr:hypothetical protein [Thalassobaculaceae bacterium]